MSTFKLTTALIAFAAAAGLSTSSFAGEGLFHFDRSSFASEGGLDAALDRIDTVAKNRCIRGGRVGLWQRRLEQECVADLKEEMVAKIADTRLTAAAEGSVFITRR